MQESTSDTRSWAYEEFGHAKLGDPRRTARLVSMAATLAERPGGKFVELFHRNAEQHGAHDTWQGEGANREILDAV